MGRILSPPVQPISECVSVATQGSAKDIRRRGRDSGNALDAGDAVRLSVLSLISSAPATTLIEPLY